MASPIIKIKRGATAPVATLNAGEFAIDQAAKNLYLGVEVGGVVSNEIVGGSGTFATKNYVDEAVSDLGSVFHYVGDVSAATGGDLDTLTDTTTGAYYKVNVTGTYTSGANSYAAKVGDAFVKTSTGWQKLDNVDAVVYGTTNEIAVSGDENAGYTVALDSVFSSRVSTAEGDIDDLETKTQNIDLAGTTAGTTKINGNLVGSGTSSISDFVIDGGVY